MLKPVVFILITVHPRLLWVQVHFVNGCTLRHQVAQKT